MDSTRAVLGIVRVNIRAACAGAIIAASAIAVQAQNVIPVYSAVDVRLSKTGTSLTNLNTYGSVPLNLSCPSTGAITGVLSGPLPAGSTTPTNLLVDNYVSLTVNSTTTNLCGPPGPGSEGNPASCFRSAYSNNPIVGTDPDYPTGPTGPLGVIGGVAPIDISSFLIPDANQVTFDLVDFGGYLASSSVNLITNCTSAGVSGNGTITGNLVTSTNPSSQLQNFTFSGAPNVGVKFVFDLSTAGSQGTLTIPPGGATPTTNDQALDPSAFPALVTGTSFATSQCLIHNGELLNNTPACKLYTVTCTIGNGTDAAGINCPKSSARNIVLQDVFDFPPLSLPDIVYTDGNFSETFHQGFGFIQASENWPGGPCTFEAGAGQLFSCPENILTEFSGPGLGRGTGTSQPGINSEFISVGPVPEYRTHVDLSPWSANQMWVNSHNITATFNTRSPILPAGFNGGDLNDFKAAPPYSITYGVAPLAGYPSVPSTEFPVPGDQSILYPGGCPAPGTPAPALWSPAPVQIHVNADGQYLLHYFATDCAGTEELYFREDNTGSWYTSFYTAIMFVDTVKPKVISGPVFSCAAATPSSCFAGTLPDGTVIFKQNSHVKATYQCSDDFSGVATCGEATYGNPVTNPPAYTSGVNTSTLGTFRYFVHVTDAAGNAGAEVLVYYAVQ
jgi:hypothetical protein